MERVLDLQGMIIEGSFKRELENLFPELIGLFEQRKSYDEYYSPYNIRVKIDLFKLNYLTDNCGYKVIIYYNTIIIED